MQHCVAAVRLPCRSTTVKKLGTELLAHASCRNQIRLRQSTSDFRPISTIQHRQHCYILCELRTRNNTACNRKLNVRKMSSSFKTANDTLKNSKLIFKQCYINGKFQNSSSGKTFTVHNPANGEEIVQVSDGDASDAQMAIDTAYEAFRTWRFTSAKDRSIILRKWASLMKENAEELAAILTLEQGKTLTDSQGEIAYAASFFDFFADSVRSIHGEIISSPDASKRYYHEKEPCGVAAMITPWNFPSGMITRKVGAAIAAGCTAVLKPAHDTPLSALALAKLSEQAGLPPGVFNIVTCSGENAAAVGKLFCSSDKVAKISFTGSTNVGKLLLKQAADTVKKVSMELGGNAPFIVFDSANLDDAVAGAIQSKYRVTGQTCVCANRLLVQSKVYDEFVEKLGAAVEKQLSTKVGDGFQSGMMQGPLINAKAVEKVRQHVDDAVKKGARVVTGGKHRRDLGEHFFDPTVLADVPRHAVCMSEETFGPVAPVIKFETEEEAVELANATPFGLAGYFFSQDVSQIFRVARRLESGMVGVNAGIISACEAPFGGVKQSGLGVEGSGHGILEYMNSKYICIGGLKEQDGGAQALKK